MFFDWFGRDELNPKGIAAHSGLSFLCRTMLHLQLPTDPRWTQLAREDLRTLLVDHAWCEHKAASNAMSIIVRNAGLTELVEALTVIAQEEMAHFGMVVERIRQRGWELGPERKDSYVNELILFLRKDGSAEERLVDRLLFSAMIEARSCERFKMLSETAEELDLRQFYRELMESEAGHYATFIGLARKYGGRVDVDKRWKDFLEYEAEVIVRYGTRPEMHG
jgi:tRNA-(ms[2]io[6]A)-hydroxylase